MSLDTQKFGISQYWFSAALTNIPRIPEIFTNKNLSLARKTFLAGKNQLASIKNWLVCSEIIDSPRRSVFELTDIGKLMAIHDERAEKAWTWWMFHVHLCSNENSLPYSTFFQSFESDSNHWYEVSDIIDILTENINNNGENLSRESISTYFQGIEGIYKPGHPIYGLGLVERRGLSGGSKSLRRSETAPSDLVVAYATILFLWKFFRNQQSVETKELLKKGVCRSLGLNQNEYRESLMRIHQHQDLNKFIQYHCAVNLDSVQILKYNLKSIQKHGYVSGDVRWA